MTCCGKTIRKTGNIVKGWTNLGRGKKCKDTDKRIRKCWTCDEQTWMSGREYATWLMRNGIGVLTNFTQLEKLPKLPKFEQGPGRTNLYCRLCKCFVPAKASEESNKCLLGKWDR